MAYFSTWAHENRVSKTRFINLIKLKEEPKRTQREKKKKKKNPETEREEPRPCCAPCATQARPCGAWRPRPTDPGSSVFLFLVFFSFSGFFSDMFWAGRLSYLIWILSPFHLFVVFLDFFLKKFVYFDLYERLESLNFLKFFLVYKSNLRHLISK